LVVSRETIHLSLIRVAIFPKIVSVTTPIIRLLKYLLLNLMVLSLDTCWWSY